MTVAGALMFGDERRTSPRRNVMGRALALVVPDLVKGGQGLCTHTVGTGAWTRSAKGVQLLGTAQELESVMYERLEEFGPSVSERLESFGVGGISPREHRVRDVRLGESGDGAYLCLGNVSFAQLFPRGERKSSSLLCVPRFVRTCRRYRYATLRTHAPSPSKATNASDFKQAGPMHRYHCLYQREFSLPP